MEYSPISNLLLEALTYLGARANGHTPEELKNRLRGRGLEDLGGFEERIAPLEELTRELDGLVTVPEEELCRLFRDLDGFPYSTTGSYSLAFLLLYPALDGYDGDFDALIERLCSMTPDEAAANMLLSLSMDDLIGDVTGCSGRFLDAVLKLTIPADSRLALVGALHGYPQLLRDAADCLRPVLDALNVRRDRLDAMALSLGGEIESVGTAEYMKSTSSLAPEDGAEYHLRPYIFGSDTNLSLSSGDGGETIYCGIHRRCLKQLLSSVQGIDTQVFDAIRLLGDRTRFDIMCYLRDHPAYGQELSDHFRLARNTIHHHMSKLLNSGLVTCAVDGNRVYYALDKPRLDRLLKQLRDLLLGSRE